MSLRRAALALLLSLAACKSPASRLDEANALRHAGRPQEALALYRDLLASLGSGRLPPDDAETRLRALQYAADVSYLELGDYQEAVAYYRRIIALHPGGPDAWHARAVIGDIFRNRFNDRLGAIAQWADIAQSGSESAPHYQLKVAREYLELKNTEQARTEARLLREKWPRSPEADEAQLLAAQAWALDGSTDEAGRAFQVAVERHPSPEIAARALEGQAHLAARTASSTARSTSTGGPSSATRRPRPSAAPSTASSGGARRPAPSTPATAPRRSTTT